MRYQPQGLARVNRQSPFLKGLIAATLPHTRNDLVSGKQYSQSGVYVASSGPDGVGLATDGSSSDIWIPIPTVSLTQFTLFGVLRSSNAGIDTRAISLGSSADPTPIIQIGVSVSNAAKVRLFARDNFSGSPADASSVSSAFDNKTHKVAITYDGSTLRCYIDGALDSSVALPSALFTVDRFSIGSLRRSSSAAFWAGTTFFAAAWNHAKSASDIASLSSNPWQLLADVDEYDEVAASAVDYVGSASGSATVSGISGKIASASGSSTANATSGSIGNANGSSAVQAISGVVASSIGISSVAALSGRVAQSSGSSAAIAVAGSVGVSQGSSVASALPLGGAVASANGSSFVAGVAGYVASASGSSIVSAYSDGIYVGSAAGESVALAVSGRVGLSAGVSTSVALSGSVGVISGSSTAVASSMALYLAQASGISSVIGVQGSVGIALGSSSAIASPIPTGIRPIEPSYGSIVVDPSYSVLFIDGSYNVLNIESDYYGNPA